MTMLSVSIAPPVSTRLVIFSCIDWKDARGEGVDPEATTCQIISHTYILFA